MLQSSENKYPRSCSRDGRFLLYYAIDPKSKAVVPVLCAALKEDEESIRKKAAAALAEIGPPAKDAFVPLAEILRDPSTDVRLVVVLALKKIDPKAAAKLGLR